MSKVITLAMLIENEACEEQVNLFRKYFGDSVEITDEVCFKYYDKFNVDWLVDNILNDGQREAYAAIEGSVWKDYQAIQGSAYEALEVNQGPAREAYKKERARAFWLAYNS